MAVAKKAAPAVKAKPVVVEDVDLLADMEEDKPAPGKGVDADGEVFDLLDGLSEDEGTPWIPDDADDPSPVGIQGKLVYKGTVPSDYGPEEVPYWVVEASDGAQWSIRGYATALRNQMNKANPDIGDLVASKYFGEKASRTGRTYKNYKVVTRKA